MSNEVVGSVKLAQLHIPLVFDTQQAATYSHPGYFSIQNRRFLGNKYKLLTFIKEIIDEEVREYQSLCDIFAGTGVVGASFNKKHTRIISNDILSSSYASLVCFLGSTKLDVEELYEKIDHLNMLRPRPNYFSDNFSETYFTYANAALIGEMREEIERISTTEEERLSLISSLIYAVDKAANTVGHYDAFRKKMTMTQKIKLRYPSLDARKNLNNEIYQCDANELIRKVNADILYLDPPYNSRQYSDTYHLLENLTNWDKPEVYGKAKKMDRNHLKSEYSLKTAQKAFADLVANANVNHILMSYNNTRNSKDSRSNALITDTQIVKVLSSRGKVKIFEKHYKSFSAGKSSSEGNVERIFYCKVH